MLVFLLLIVRIPEHPLDLVLCLVPQSVAVIENISVLFCHSFYIL